MSQTQTAREEVAKVASLILTARRLLAGGRLVDLTAVENRVRSVCQTIAGMPREDGRTLIEELKNLVDMLGHLDHDLHQQLELTLRRVENTPDGGWS